MSPLSGTPYAGYLYAYPHKTAYRPFAPLALEALWREEKKDALALYLHVPFCEMRCGFCNLFTTVHHDPALAEAWIAQLERQAQVVRAALGEARFHRLAIGGGTPTDLPLPILARLLDLAQGTMGAAPGSIPTSVETSPETATPERLGLLAARGVDRLSIGVQSFVEEECRALGRPQRTARVLAALDAIRSQPFATLNIDLMYGIPGQSEQSLAESLDRALAFRPEELYLYPLYIRALTGLARHRALAEDPAWDRQRLGLYRFGRDYLLDRGYQQLSMRLFRSGPEADAPIHYCQEDGMVGLGVGARSYTRAVHYAWDYAVGAGSIREIIADYLRRDQAALARAEYGFLLDGEEQRRRCVILSLLQDGLDLGRYRARFGQEAVRELPELALLPGMGLAQLEVERLSLTERGRERSDAIGPWLCSPAVRARMGSYALA